ncbi:MAG: cupin domain-containing protein [Patescibacteria group bacterium]
MNLLNSFTDIIAPIKLEKFITEYWNPKKHLLIRGEREKFIHLLTWQTINEMILGREHDTSGRLRLVKNGKDIPISAVTILEARRFRTKKLPRLKRTLLSDCLRGGAVLILNRVDDIHEPVRQLAEMIEYMLHERAYINMYAGWPSSKGFNLHWDDHDVIVLQIHGKKRWTISGFSKEAPLYKEAENIRAPEGKPLWSGVIHAGDLLYVPRGCWHGAEALDSPTVHLTCGLYNQTGHDMLSWLQSKLVTTEVFCRELPRFSSETAQQQHTQKLKQALEALWNDRLLQTFFVENDMMAQPHERLAFPFGVSSTEETQIKEETIILMRNPRPIQIKSDSANGEVVFCALGKQWRFHANALTLLSFLDKKRKCSFGDFRKAVHPTVNDDTLKAFVRELFREGMVFLQ